MVTDPICNAFSFVAISSYTSPHTSLTLRLSNQYCRGNQTFRYNHHTYCLWLQQELAYFYHFINLSVYFFFRKVLSPVGNITGIETFYMREVSIQYLTYFPGGIKLIGDGQRIFEIDAGTGWNHSHKSVDIVYFLCQFANVFDFNLTLSDLYLLSSITTSPRGRLYFPFFKALMI